MLDFAYWQPHGHVRIAHRQLEPKLGDIAHGLPHAVTDRCDRTVVHEILNAPQRAARLRCRHPSRAEGGDLAPASPARAVAVADRDHVAALDEMQARPAWARSQVESDAPELRGGFEPNRRRSIGL